MLLIPPELCVLSGIPEGLQGKKYPDRRIMYAVRKTPE